jgi:hypothetical protein
VVRLMAELCSRPGGPRGLRRGYARVSCWDSVFASRRGHGCLSVVNGVRCTGRSLCGGPTSRPRESYRVWCVCVCVIVDNQKQQ